MAVKDTSDVIVRHKLRQGVAGGQFDLALPFPKLWCNARKPECRIHVLLIGARDYSAFSKEPCRTERQALRSGMGD